MNAEQDHLEEGRLDLVPMIDCIMLLLLFFILTTKFNKDDMQLASLLSSQGPSPQRVTIEPPRSVVITAWPAGVEAATSEADAARIYRATVGEVGLPQRILLRVGGGEPLLVDAMVLAPRLGTPAALAASVAELERIHQHLATALKPYESTGQTRDKQPPVVLRLFSRLPWKMAAAVYDAVRGFEKANGGVVREPKDFEHARTVDFAPPLIRNHTANELGRELFEIVHTKAVGRRS